MSERGAEPPPPAMVVTEQQIAEALESLLRETNAFSSFNDVVQQLESKLGVDLSHIIDFIRTQIGHILRLPVHPQNFVTHQHHYRFPLPQTPNFRPAPTPQPNPNFVAHHAPEGYGFRPPPPQPHSSQTQPQPSPLPPLQLVGKNPSVPPTSIPAKESAPKKRRGGPGGLNKLCGVTPELQTIVSSIVIISETLASFFGTEEREMSQAEVLRQMWEYIKVNQLEDPLNPTDIICDGKLQELLGCESISALGIPEILAQRCLSKKS